MFPETIKLMGLSVPFPLFCLLVYLLLVNLIAFILYGIDKRRAKKRYWRIPERRLIGIAVIGGSIGALLGIRVFHHKTLHKKFTVGIPVILALQLLLACAVLILTNDSLRNLIF